MIKACSHCGKVKRCDEFNKNKSTKDGLCSRCKSCKQKSDKKYRIQNREKISKHKKEFYNKNYNAISMWHKKYYKKNRGIYIDRQRKRREKDPNLYIRYYLQNRLSILKKSRMDYNNPDLTNQRVIKIRDRLYWVYGGGRYIHDVIAEKILGRRLKRGEVVHHVDGNGLNNRHDNLIICMQSYHVYLHNKMAVK